MRAAHLHFMVTAAGYRTLVTHIFVAGDPHSNGDTVFGVKESLIKNFEQPPAPPPPTDATSARPGPAPGSTSCSLPQP